MRRQLSAVVLATLAFSTPVMAQEDWVRDLLLATQLPIMTLNARTEGVPHGDIVTILDAVRRAGLPAREALLIIDTTRAVHRDKGPTNNFGAFVQSQLAAGKRGTDLAAAIHAEHARLGKGRGNVGKSGVDQGRGDGSNAAGGRGRGNDAVAGNPKPDDAARGKSGNPNKPAATTPSRGKPPEAGRGRGGPPTR
jgi:hypothetical protein